MYLCFCWFILIYIFTETNKCKIVNTPFCFSFSPLLCSDWKYGILDSIHQWQVVSLSPYRSTTSQNSDFSSTCLYRCFDTDDCWSCDLSMWMFNIMLLTQVYLDLERNVVTFIIVYSVQQISLKPKLFMHN